MSKMLFEIAAEIVQTQVSSSHMSPGEIASSLREAFKTLQEIQKSEAEGISLEVTQPGQETAAEEAPKLTSADSIQENKVICLECGAEMKQLTQKHLASHSMNQREYKKKYGFAMKTPLVAKSLSKARSKAVKKRGLPKNLKKYQEERKAKVTSPIPEPFSILEKSERKATTRTRLQKKETV
jgi:predicted transcriptional regulator